LLDFLVRLSVARTRVTWVLESARLRFELASESLAVS
jgi:hypothetical protein